MMIHITERALELKSEDTALNSALSVSTRCVDFGELFISSDTQLPRENGTAYPYQRIVVMLY